MKVIKMLDLHYSCFVMYVDEIDPEEIKKYTEFVPKVKFLWLIYKE